jgi:hypothetical protein
MIEKIAALIDAECNRRGFSDKNALIRRIGDLEEELKQARRLLSRDVVDRYRFGFTPLENLIVNQLCSVSPRIVTLGHLIDAAELIFRRSLSIQGLRVAVHKANRKLGSVAKIRSETAIGYWMEKESADAIRREV